MLEAGYEVSDDEPKENRFSKGLSGKRRPLSHNRAKSARPMFTREINSLKNELTHMDREQEMLQKEYEALLEENEQLQLAEEQQQDQK